LRFLGILLRVLRLEVSVYNVYITIGEIVTSALYGTVLKPNSWTYGFIEVSGHNLEILRLEFFVYNVNYKHLSNHFCSGRGGGVE
jgi:hypothetical protein